MAYIENLKKLIDLVNSDTYEDGMTTGNETRLAKSVSELFMINRALVTAQFNELVAKAKVENGILQLEDVDLNSFQINYEDQLQKAKYNIQELNNLCEKYHVTPFYENDLFDDRTIMEFVNTFTHAIADARIKSYYKEKEHMVEKDLTKQAEAEDYAERE